MSDLIFVKDLKKEYGNESMITKVLKGLNFTIKKGEFISIIGPSGSGKSTLMHILGLLERPSSGTYTFENEDVGKLDDRKTALLRNRKIGFIFQNFNLLPRMTVLDNVKLPLGYSENKKNMKSRAKKVLENVGLGERLDFFPNQISGGQKQRVAIARALVNNPSIIFADEPTGNLDSKSSTQIMEILKRLNQEGNTIILVTHDPRTTKYTRRTIRIEDGKITEK
jgi:ABC-type lipoprotein export system ATPase subunit